MSETDTACFPVPNKLIIIKKVSLFITHFEGLDVELMSLMAFT